MRKVKNAEIEVGNVKNQYAALVKETKNEMEKAKSMIAENERIKEKQKEIVKKKAEKLNENFKKSYSSVVLLVGLYSFLVTMFTGFKSERFMIDLQNCSDKISDVVSEYVDEVDSLITGFANAFENISVLYWIIYAVLWIVGAIISIGIIFFALKLVIEIYKKYCADEISVLVALLSIAVVVFFAEYMPINIVLILLISQIMYIGIRWYIYDYRQSRGM